MDKIKIYCDGACLGNPGPGGAAAIVATKDRVDELGVKEETTTNNRMELRAALLALQFILWRESLKEKEIQVLSDSSYMLQGAKKWVHKWSSSGWKNSEGEDVKNQDLWKELSEAIQKISGQAPIEWTHVEGHAGIPGNERADELAQALATGKTVKFYQGSRREYPVDLEFMPAPSGSSKQEPYYLSFVGNKVYKDKTWKECEARVRGVTGAKYKKCKNSQEEEKILKDWGVSCANKS